MIPNKIDQKHSQEAKETLIDMVNNNSSNTFELRVDEINREVKLPISIAHLMIEILDNVAKGKEVKIVAKDNQYTTQAAADYLNCSRPHVVKLLETSQIPYEMVGRHRRILYSDLVNYRSKMKRGQKDMLINLMNLDEEEGNYDD